MNNTESINGPSLSLPKKRFFDLPVPMNAKDGLALEDLKHCRLTLNNGSRSFLAASHLLPTQMRNAATALYAFCREADDLIDLGDDKPAALKKVQERVAQVFGDDLQDNPADRALASVVHHYRLPKPLLDALIEGFAWDVDERTYNSLDDVEDYAARVAGTVGAMMSLLMGAREPSVVARACDLGVAMQLTNICRDVGEDARAGRCYLPGDWLREAGVDPANVLAPEASQVVRQVVKSLLDRAEVLYQRADAGIAVLPEDCQRGIRVARHLYASIGDEIAKANYIVTDRRAFVPAQQKLKLVAIQWQKNTIGSMELLGKPPLRATAWLVDAVADVSVVQPTEVYKGLVEKPSTTREEVLTVIRVLDRLEHSKRNELQAGSGKVPFGFAGVVR